MQRQPSLAIADNQGRRSICICDKDGPAGRRGKVTALENHPGTAALSLVDNDISAANASILVRIENRPPRAVSGDRVNGKERS